MKKKGVVGRLSSRRRGRFYRTIRLVLDSATFVEVLTVSRLA
jgi:hypothetical protein